MENQILREKLGGNRVLLRDDQRRRLAIKGAALGRQPLKKIATIAQADTILRWHRELVEVNRYTQPRENNGRPTTDQKIVELVLRMARENTSWGDKRIEGASQPRLCHLLKHCCEHTEATRYRAGAYSQAHNQLVNIPPSTLGGLRGTRLGRNHALVQQTGELRLGLHFSQQSDSLSRG